MGQLYSLLHKEQLFSNVIKIASCSVQLFLHSTAKHPGELVAIANSGRDGGQGNF